MRAIKSKDTEIERQLIKELKKRGYKFKTNFSKLTGKPDIAFLKKRLVILLDSCFWHGCRIHCRLPQANRTYWKAKIDRNKKRDREVNEFYKKNGWKILRFWEHEIKKNPEKTLKKIGKYLGK